MTTRERILFFVKAAGPVSCIKVARMAGVPQPIAYRTLYQLRQDNLVVRKGPRAYDITKRGLRVASFENVTPSLF
jgi:DNA-binding IclR family transcriptional regulator